MAAHDLIDKLYTEHDLTDGEYLQLLRTARISIADADPTQIISSAKENRKADTAVEYLFQRARKVREFVYGKDIFLRGLIEFTNYCKNNCYYCGIRAGNAKCDRYRLSKDVILDCTDKGYELGFRTFVLQGGEDPYFTDEKVCEIVSEIKERHPDCAITLSIGEKSKGSYQAYFDAGADRYLLRHETADEAHYGKLHPQELSLANRKRCLFDLKEIGYQVGCGMMVGSPYQTDENYLSDIRFMQELSPHMIGIGPFIPHKDTPFKEEQPGTLNDTLIFLAILRLVFPHILLPATTALGTISPIGRELGFLAGANVVMPNLSPGNVRGKYLLYDGKLCTGDEAAQSHRSMEARAESVGYHVTVSRGDFKRKMSDMYTEAKRNQIFYASSKLHRSKSGAKSCGSDT